ncbi:hypothetical protein AMAG_19701 [Allomyces macrogynus ATCC 38327]|uniref:Cytochrome P450 n=1 Tax=Allomyces macrogynus (strain ATCC 38327) TaxID=578462 RepID=A0A0L0SZ13_ALLM3|nr:hypothetical protein AMAG_19701 [Allomyces macrogynus ATCC 38327]|eukprot:KNE67737.1 hypothetical protein AMAG_19701 [Allomyces macrogynus ATCC 38327]
MAALVDKRADASDDKESRDFLAMMIDASMCDAKFTRQDLREDLRANTIIIFTAGHDTMANALSFAIYLLGTHPGVQERARQEVIDIMGDMNPNTPAYTMPFSTAEQEKAMTLLACCIKEVMRLYPSINNLPPRCTTADVTLHDGTVLPKGTLINADICSLHRARNVWGLRR